MEISFEEVKKHLEGYGEHEITNIPLAFIFDAKDENRQLTEDEMRIATCATWLYKQVEGQMMHLANICDEPIQNPARLDSEEHQRLFGRLIDGDLRGEEKIAARALLVKKHKPTPDDLEGEEWDNWYCEQRSEFVALHDITVSEAIDYYAYWEQEREGTEAMRWFANEMHIAHEVEEVTGGDPPKNIMEFINYLTRKAKEGEEDS